jgi:hypothetical protein
VQFCDEVRRQIMYGPEHKANIHFKSSCPVSANAPILRPSSGSLTNNSQRPITYSRRHAPNGRARTGRSCQEAKEEGKRAGRNQDPAIRATTRLSTAPIASRNAHKSYDHLFGSTPVTFGKRSTGRIGRRNLKPAAQSPALLRTPRLLTDP